TGLELSPMDTSSAVPIALNSQTQKPGETYGLSWLCCRMGRQCQRRTPQSERKNPIGVLQFGRFAGRRNRNCEHLPKYLPGRGAAFNRGRSVVPRLLDGIQDGACGKRQAGHRGDDEAALRIERRGTGQECLRQEVRCDLRQENESVSVEGEAKAGPGA